MKLNGHNPFAEGEETKVVLEDSGGKFGFRFRYEHTDAAVAFVAWSIIGRQPDGLQLALFAHAEVAGDLTPHTILASPYCSGAIKADGSWWIHSNAVGVGPTHLRRYTALVRHLWERSYSLMGKSPVMPWAEA